METEKTENKIQISATQRDLLKILQSDTVPPNLVISIDLLRSKNYKALAESMPISLAKAIDQGIPMMIVSKAAENELIAFIEFELIKLSRMVNIDSRLNLQRHQIPVIAQGLYEDFKYESMEDISLCLRRGSTGRYSPNGIFRLDAAVISQWMAAFLEEKYQIVESNLAKEKVKPNEPKTGNKKTLLDLYKMIVGDVEYDETNKSVNDYEKWKLDNQYKYYTVDNLQIYATSQAHAEQLVQKMIDNGELEQE